MSLSSTSSFPFTLLHLYKQDYVVRCHVAFSITFCLSSRSRLLRTLQTDASTLSPWLHWFIHFKIHPDLMCWYVAKLNIVSANLLLLIHNSAVNIVSALWCSTMSRDLADSFDIQIKWELRFKKISTKSCVEHSVGDQEGASSALSRWIVPWSRKKALRRLFLEDPIFHFSVSDIEECRWNL